MILIFLLIDSSICTRITNPSIEILEESISTYNFTKQVYEKLIIPYGEYPGVFAIDLHKRVNGDIEQQNINLGDFELVEESINQEQGCYAQQRNININLQLKLWLDKTGITQNIYFTDLAVSENEQSVFIIRNDFKLFKVNINPGLYAFQLSNENISLANALQVDINNPDNLPFLVTDTELDQIYLISTYGSINFNSKDSFQNVKFNIQQQFKKRDIIYNVEYNEKNKIILVAVGYDGVDIYKINDGQLDLFMNVNTTILGIENAQIIDVGTNGEDMLYILDKEIGLRFYSLTFTQQQKIKYLFTINISNAKSFDFFENTFFIVAKTVNKQDYAVEIFVNQNTYNYYFNNYYIDEMTINDVKVFEYYTILIGDDGHKIVYHSIYQGFLNEKLIQHTSFKQSNLRKIKEYDTSYLQTSSSRILVGIAKYEFSMLDITMNMPKIICSFDSVQSNQYYVIINSTNCAEKDELNNLNYQFILCNLTQTFQLTTIQQQGISSVYAYYTLFIYVLIIAIIWITIIICQLLNRYGIKIKCCKFKGSQNDNSGNYTENFELREQELPSTIRR